MDNEKVEINLMAFSNHKNDLQKTFQLEIQTRLRDFLKQIKLVHYRRSVTQPRIQMYYKSKYITEFINSKSCKENVTTNHGIDDPWIRHSIPEFLLTMSAWLLINQSAIESGSNSFIPNIIRLNRPVRSNK